MPDHSSSRRLLAARLLPLLDLTSLGEDDTPERIETLCAAARRAPPAAVCIYPEHIGTARRALLGTPVRIATVVNFPDGADDASRVVRETRRALAAGADEIDLVLPFAALCHGAAERAREAVVACRQACADGTVLKLILETGVLETTDRIRQACWIGIEAGVDFLKTSTGKAAVGATPAAAACMLDVIAAAGGTCGLKAAGGIRTLEQAAVYLGLAEARLGADWIEPRRFRLGASTLFDELCGALREP